MLPICVIGSLVLVRQGVPQNLGAYTVATTLDGAQPAIAHGPVASQMMIKHFGTNGGVPETLRCLRAASSGVGSKRCYVRLSYRLRIEARRPGCAAEHGERNCSWSRENHL
jgi:hypothetical protein